MVQRKPKNLPLCLHSLGLHEGVSHLLNLPRLRLHLLLSRALLLQSLFNHCHLRQSPSRRRLHVRLVVHRRLRLRTILHQTLCHLDPETDPLVHFNKFPHSPSSPKCVNWCAVLFHTKPSIQCTVWCRRHTVVVAHLIIVIRNR